MTAALSHLKTFNQDLENPMVDYAKGAALANCVHWIGMGSNEELESVIKPAQLLLKLLNLMRMKIKFIKKLNMQRKWEL